MRWVWRREDKVGKMIGGGGVLVVVALAGEGRGRVDERDDGVDGGDLGKKRWNWWRKKMIMIWWSDEIRESGVW